MGRLKYLFKNTFLYSISTFSTKIISFLMVSFYTAVLSTELYGQIDIIFATIHLIIPVAALSINNSILRFSMDKETDKSNIFLIGLIVTSIGSVVVILVSFGLNWLFEYAFLCGILIALEVFFLFFSEYIRGMGKNGIYVACNILLSALIAVLNLVFLGVINLEIRGYIYAYILSYLICCLIMIAYINPLRVLKRVAPEKIKNDSRVMLKYCVYLIPNSIFWWITNSSDKYMIVFFIGNAFNGIYSVSNKIPTIVTSVFQIFTQAWQLSAIKESGSENEGEFVNDVFKALFVMLSFVVSFLTLIIKPFMSVYVSEAYYSAWESGSILVMAGMFNILSSFVGIQYVVAKSNKMNMYTTLLGALVNIGLNAILIPMLKLNGAAIATCASYIVVLIVRLIDTRKYLVIQIKPIYIFLFLMLIAQIILLFVENNIGLTLEIFVCIILCIVCVINIKDDISLIYRQLFRHK